MTTTTKKNHGAVKGTVAAAAGVAVLLGGAGTFALWNQSGAIGTAATETGSLTAEFGAMAWQDTTTGAGNPIAKIEDFRMVPGDTVVGTSTIDVTATGENLLVDAALDTADNALPSGVTATVVLSDGSTTGETLELTGSNDGAEHQLTATVTLTFAANAEGDATMTQPIDLTNMSIDLQQRLNS